MVDLRRIVDEFSKFARMPEPETRAEDAVALDVREGAWRALVAGVTVYQLHAQGMHRTEQAD